MEQSAPENKCGVSIGIDENGEINFDCYWDSEEYIDKLGQLIFIITRSDYIIRTLKSMETDSLEDKARIIDVYRHYCNQPIIKPVELSKHAKSE